MSRVSQNIPKLTSLVGGFCLYWTIVLPCAGEDILALEDKASERLLSHFVRTLQNARNISVYPNIHLLPNEHLAEQTSYCEAIVDAARKKDGDGISIPPPNMSSGRDGNAAIFERIKIFTAPCRTSNRWLKDGIPNALLRSPEYPRFFSIYELKGANPWTVVLERRFHDNRYNDIQSTLWVNFFPDNTEDVCYAVADNSANFPPGGAVDNHKQAGVLQFEGRTFFYSTWKSEDRPRHLGYDPLRKWNIFLFAPQMSTEELSSKEAAAFYYAKYAPHWYCSIAYD